MPTAREALLDAACSALSRQPWTSVRMVDVAARAGVSRQTLYNEFGGKDGLARALIRRAADDYLAGVDRVLDPARRRGTGPAALARWTVGSAKADTLVRALLTGVWGERLPVPAASTSGRRADGPALPTPGELLRLVRERAVAALEDTSAEGTAGLELRCEVALRLALSYTQVPASQAEEPDSCRPITPMMTSEMETSLSVETTSPRKTIP
ncbi:TetR/AcrR family transcriptional regulator [Streptomyces sp. NPDC051784]|uniref:TetR/AcrR family transcriptional regulator n=1 Tax=Streptomyces sp. NPDC051784 TaxID=3155805 RepID=UPI003435C066